MVLGSQNREVKPPESALTSNHGLYQFSRMSYRLKNAVAALCRARDKILLAVCWQSALVDLDKFDIFLEIFEQYSAHP